MEQEQTILPHLNNAVRIRASGKIGIEEGKRIYSQLYDLFVQGVKHWKGIASPPLTQTGLLPRISDHYSQINFTRVDTDNAPISTSATSLLHVRAESERSFYTTSESASQVMTGSYSGLA